MPFLTTLVCRGPGSNPWPPVPRSGHSTYWATGAGSEQSRPEIEPVTSRSPKRTLYLLSYRDRFRTTAARDRTRDLSLPEADTLPTVLPGQVQNNRGPGSNPWPLVPRSGHSTYWATGAGSEQSRPGIEPVTSRFPKRTLYLLSNGGRSEQSRPGIEPVTSRSPKRTVYLLSYRGRFRTIAARDRTRDLPFPEADSLPTELPGPVQNNRGPGSNPDADTLPTELPGQIQNNRGPGSNPWPPVPRSGHSTYWATGTGSEQSRPAIEPVTSRFPKRTLYLLSYRYRFKTIAARDRTRDLLFPEADTLPTELPGPVQNNKNLNYNYCNMSRAMTKPTK